MAEHFRITQPVLDANAQLFKIDIPVGTIVKKFGDDDFVVKLGNFTFAINLGDAEFQDKFEIVEIVNPDEENAGVGAPQQGNPDEENAGAGAPQRGGRRRKQRRSTKKNKKNRKSKKTRKH